MEPWIKGQKSYPGPSNNSARERSMGTSEVDPGFEPCDWSEHTQAMCISVQVITYGVARIF